MTPFWYSWPSWVTELLGGMVLSLALCFLLLLLHMSLAAQLGLAALGGVLLSVVYERFLDPNDTVAHRPAVDIGQRACGQVLGLLVWALIRG